MGAGAGRDPGHRVRGDAEIRAVQPDGHDGQADRDDGTGAADAAAVGDEGRARSAQPVRQFQRHARIRIGARVFHRHGHRHLGRSAVFDHFPDAGRLYRRQYRLGSGRWRHPYGSAGAFVSKADGGTDGSDAGGECARHADAVRISVRGGNPDHPAWRGPGAADLDRTDGGIGAAVVGSAAADIHPQLLGAGRAAGDLYHHGRRWRLSGFCREFHCRHHHRHRHSDRAHLGAAVAIIRDAGALVERQGGAGRAGADCQRAPARRRRAALSSPRQDHRRV